MNITKKQQEAADTVVQAARILQNAARNAERLGLDVSISYYSDEVHANVKLKQEELVASTKKEGK
jgi:ABC-type metal ion transport system substrate-binding protein